MKKILLMLLLISGSAFSVSQSPEYSEDFKKLLPKLTGNFQAYDWKPDVPLKQRVTKCPAPILQYLQKLDNRPYQDQDLSPQDRILIEEYLDMLPPAVKKILDKKLLGIHFIPDFWGSGLADWTIGPDGETYYFMVFNSATLTDTISERLTLRASSCFIKEDPFISVEVKADSPYRSLLYILWHEVGHVVDYEEHHTPPSRYLVEYLKKSQNYRSKKTDFVKNYWKYSSVPLEKYDFDKRKDLTFYGFGKGPRIPYSDASLCYTDLSKSPFFSLYGSSGWTEDFAEYFAHYYLTQVLKVDVITEFKAKNIVVESWNPLDNPLVQRRLKYFDRFYK